MKTPRKPAKRAYTKRSAFWTRGARAAAKRSTVAPRGKKRRYTKRSAFWQTAGTGERHPFAGTVPNFRVTTQLIGAPANLSPTGNNFVTMERAEVHPDGRLRIVLRFVPAPSSPLG